MLEGCEVTGWKDYRDQLDKELKARKDDLDQASAVVLRKYGAMGKGNWEVGNPTKEEDEAVEEAWEEFQSVLRRIREFSKKNQTP